MTLLPLVLFGAAFMSHRLGFTNSWAMRMLVMAAVVIGMSLILAVDWDSVDEVPMGTSDEASYWDVGRGAGATRRR